MAHAHYSCEQLLGTGEEEADLLPASSVLACLFFLLMDLVPPTDRLCYVRCTYCNTVLAVGVPCKRVMDTVTVKCGHCSHLSFLSPRATVQSLTPTDHRMGLQGPCSDCLRGQPSPPSSSSNSSEQMIQKPRFVMKPPEKKHRMPSAYNRFMKEEIQRIKAAKPDIPHREAFSMASKNWAKCDPRCSTTISTSSGNSSGKSYHSFNKIRNRSIDVDKLLTEGGLESMSNILMQLYGLHEFKITCSSSPGFDNAWKDN
ncbi:unnamed protein product [Musa hybrid cultivar]